MPRENIERAIARGAGAGEGGESYEAVSYEGYGSGGAALIVEGLTDNRNRTAADVRFLFGKYGGSLGAPGSVAWMFERKGLITVPSEGVDLDELTLVAADGGAEDVRDNGTAATRSSPIRPISRPASRARGSRHRVSSADLTMEAQTTIDVDVDQARSLLRLVEALEEHDDVQDVYFNFDIPDGVLEEAVERPYPRAGCSSDSSGSQGASASSTTSLDRRSPIERMRRSASPSFTNWCA